MTPEHYRTASTVGGAVSSVRAATGIEALVWLTDVGGRSRDDAVELVRWSAQALLQRAIGGSPPP